MSGQEPAADQPKPGAGRKHARPPLLLGLSLVPVLLLGVSLGGCTAGEGMEGMPAEVEAAPPVVREAYVFAAAHPEVLTQIPCYCGCGAIGHTSNYACYVSDVEADGTIAYDLHAVGCSICIDITRDTMRMLDQGLGVAQVRAQIDATYSAFGPSNMP